MADNFLDSVVVFLVDVIFKYRAIGNWKIFLRKHWFDILLLIPFFRILSDENVAFVKSGKSR